MAEHRKASGCQDDQETDNRIPKNYQDKETCIAVSQTKEKINNRNPTRDKTRIKHTKNLALPAKTMRLSEAAQQAKLACDVK